MIARCKPARPSDPREHSSTPLRDAFQEAASRKRKPIPSFHHRPARFPPSTRLSVMPGADGLRFRGFPNLSPRVSRSLHRAGSSQTLRCAEPMSVCASRTTDGAVLPVRPAPPRPSVRSMPTLSFALNSRDSLRSSVVDAILQRFDAGVPDRRKTRNLLAGPEWPRAANPPSGIAPFPGRPASSRDSRRKRAMLRWPMAPPDVEA
jgi:hypothetical protein